MSNDISNSNRYNPMQGFDPFRGETDEGRASERSNKPLTAKEKMAVWAGSVLLFGGVAAAVAGIAAGSGEDLKSPSKPTGEYVNILPSHPGEGVNEIANDLTGEGYSPSELKSELNAIAQENGGNVPNDTMGFDSSLITEHDPAKLAPYGVELNQQGQPANPPEMQQ